MLKITIPATKLYDEKRNLFISTKEQTLQLEHSLISVSKWESKWCIPFFGKTKDDKKTQEQSLDYIRCMTITQNVDDDTYYAIQHYPNIVKAITEYIAAPMTATWIREDPNKTGVREIVTSELIYYWMLSYGIPLECEKWHLNRLMMLIRVFNAKNNSSSNGSKGFSRESAAARRNLNKQRRAAAHSRG